MYVLYDIIARRWQGWGFVYPFVELGLVLAYLLHFNPRVTNAITFWVMLATNIGVLQAVLNKREIRFACLPGCGIEFAYEYCYDDRRPLMIGMSAVMMVSFGSQLCLEARKISKTYLYET